MGCGTYGGGLNRLDPATGTVRSTTVTIQRLGTAWPATSCLSVVSTGKGVLWVGTEEGGLNRFDRTSGRFNGLSDDSGVELRQLDIRGPSGNPLAWGRTAVSAGSTLDGAVHGPSHDPRDPRSISHDEVWAVHEDKQGRLWVGTSAVSIELDRTRGTFTSITQKDGLAGNIGPGDPRRRPGVSLAGDG